MIRTDFTKAALSAFAAATLFAGLAAPAHAASEAGERGRSSGSTGQMQSSDASEARDRRICVRFELTASRLSRTICRTEREWEARGGVPTD